MTELVHRHNAYQKVFCATVQDQLTVEGRPAVILDRTAFYATAGGQPHDLGTLNNANVIDVRENPQGVIHVLNHPLKNTTVQGQIDWDRRFDHMQQHSGQHVLSAAFIQILDAPTIGFHLGDNVATIDIAAQQVSDDQLASVEKLANRVVMENRPIRVFECSLSEARDHNLRKLPAVQGPVRIVDIQDFDKTACCGTHVRTTGELGMIHIRSISRRHDATRVEFLCGWRAAQDYARRDRILQSQANLLSVSIDDFENAVKRLQEACSKSQKDAQRLRRQLLDLQLAELASTAQEIDGRQVIAATLAEYDAAAMRYSAQQLLQEPGRIVLLAVTEPTPQVVFASSTDSPLHMGKLLKNTLAPFGGRGGGKPNMAQGGGFNADQADEVLNTAIAQLTAPKQ